MVKTVIGRGGRELIGRLEDESLLEVIEPLCRGNASAHLQIQYGGEQGHFYFKNGKMVHASTRSIRGKESAYYLISWRNGVFRLARGREPEVQTVDIDWQDFQRLYKAELQKIVQNLLPLIEDKFFLRLSNLKAEQVFIYDDLLDAGTRKFVSVSFKKEETEDVLTNLQRGNIEECSTKVTGADGKDYLFLVRYLKELRYFVEGVFFNAERAGAYRRWLVDVFEPRALDAVSTALHRADKTDVRGIVMVIDDSPTVREMLSDMLGRNGFKVFLAEDGYEGLVKARDTHPDVIILDVLMPRIDGYEVCRRLKEDDTMRQIPIIMLTVRGLEEDKGEGFREGADLYIEKPFTEKKILTIVESVLELE
jgi:twitching motility two-component system response regulator PilH